jgi:hypothetical protein
MSSVSNSSPTVTPENTSGDDNGLGAGLGADLASLGSDITEAFSSSSPAVPPASTPNPNPNPEPSKPTQAIGPASGFSLTFISSSTVATILFVLTEIGLIYYYFVRSVDALSNRIMWFVIFTVLAGLLIYGSYFIFQGTFTSPTWSGTVTPATGVTTNTAITVPGSTIPVTVGTNGGNYGAQWWMFIQDWNYMFGQEKTVITRGGAGQLNPYVYLDAVENTLNFKINLMSGGGGSGGSSMPAGVGFTGSTDDSYTCKVSHIPIQSWFCISLSVSNRNVDIYLNGMLVRSCLLPGIPKAPAGDVGVMTSGGYSGSLAGLNFYAGALNPNMASSFYRGGPPPAAVAQVAASSTTPTQPYTVKLAVVDPTGQTIRSYSA